MKNSQEFIIEHKSYKKGYCIKIQNSIVIDTNKIHTITGVTKNSSGELNYIIDIKLEDLSNSTILYNHFHYSYVYRDDECKKMERKLKLEKLNSK